MTKAELIVLATTGAPAAILIGSLALAAREWKEWGRFLRRSRADQQYGRLLDVKQERREP